MSIIIKKITRNTFFSILSLGSLFLTVIVRLFLGGVHIDFKKLGSNTNKMVNGANIISVVHAEVPSDSSGDNSSDSADSDSAGDCDEGSCEGEGTEGEGEGEGGDSQ
jgi:hypothetical protein